MVSELNFANETSPIVARYSQAKVDSMVNSWQPALWFLRQVEVQMGLRPNIVLFGAEVLASTAASGIRNVVEQEREVLVVRTGNSDLPAEPQVENASV